MQNGVFFVLFVEIFLFYTPFRETTQRAEPAQAFCAGSALCGCSMWNNANTLS